MGLPSLPGGAGGKPRQMEPDVRRPGRARIPHCVGNVQSDRLVAGSGEGKTRGWEDPQGRSNES